MVRFENDEVGVLFTGKNLVEIGDFLSGMIYEFRGSNFLLPSPLGDVQLNIDEFLVKRKDGSFYTLSQDLLQYNIDRDCMEQAKPAPKRGGKKK